MTSHTYSVLSSSKVILLLQRCGRLNGITGEMNLTISFPVKSSLTYKFLNACSHPFLYQGNVHCPCFIHHNYVSIPSLLVGFILWSTWGTSNISEFTHLQFDIRGMLLLYCHMCRRFSCLTYMFYSVAKYESTMFARCLLGTSLQILPWYFGFTLPLVEWSM
jgi:hypothetical protein